MWKNKKKKIVVEEKEHMGTVQVSHKGDFRFSSDLFPVNGGRKDFVVSLQILPVARRIVFQRLEKIRPAKNSWPQTGLLRRVWFSNKGAKEPIVSAMAVLRFFGMKPPKKAVEYKAQKLTDGSVMVQL